MDAEDDLLPLSGLQHLLYCERQCALIHVEGQWAGDLFTAEGDASHRSSAPAVAPRAGAWIETPAEQGPDQPEAEVAPPARGVTLQPLPFGQARAAWSTTDLNRA